MSSNLTSRHHARSRQRWLILFSLGLMKPTTRNTLIFLIGFVFGAVGLLSTPLGLPDWTSAVGIAVFAASIWIVNWLHKRDKRRGFVTPPPNARSQNRKMTVYILIGLFVACATSPFTDPYLGVSLPFGSRIVISIVIFMVLAPLIVVLRRRREKT